MSDPKLSSLGSYFTTSDSEPPTGTTINIKIDSSFVEKPLKIKKDGSFQEVSNMQIGGWT